MSSYCTVPNTDIIDPYPHLELDHTVIVDVTLSLRTVNDSEILPFQIIKLNPFRLVSNIHIFLYHSTIQKLVAQAKQYALYQNIKYIIPKNEVPDCKFPSISYMTSTGHPIHIPCNKYGHPQLRLIEPHL